VLQGRELPFEPVDSLEEILLRLAGLARAEEGPERETQYDQDGGTQWISLRATGSGCPRTGEGRGRRSRELAAGPVDG